MDDNTKKAIKLLVSGDVSKDDIITRLIDNFPDVFISCCTQEIKGKYVYLRGERNRTIRISWNVFQGFNYYHKYSLNSGNKISAIKALREWTKDNLTDTLSLKEAKEIVEQGVEVYLKNNPQIITEEIEKYLLTDK